MAGHTVSLFSLVLTVLQAGCGWWFSLAVSTVRKGREASAVPSLPFPPLSPLSHNRLSVLGFLPLLAVLGPTMGYQVAGSEGSWGGEIC